MKHFYYLDSLSLLQRYSRLTFKCQLSRARFSVLVTGLRVLLAVKYVPRTRHTGLSCLYGHFRDKEP